EGRPRYLGHEALENEDVKIRYCRRQGKIAVGRGRKSSLDRLLPRDAMAHSPADKLLQIRSLVPFKPWTRRSSSSEQGPPDWVPPTASRNSATRTGFSTRNQTASAATRPHMSMATDSYGMRAGTSFFRT